ncbi:OmpP1/FadL family transporter [Paraferrimonas sp. SM1919]|uniref:OmpP1/FadL family transporter n=1 Tax=Paraferrimonas sp. SM1919 TaxID=2662263 RepID=UPI0013D72347|nr:outer membrane protein transport protein [Paraferrimonas sp. SM1919]
MKKLTPITLAIATAVMGTSTAYAAGFQTTTHSATGMGRANAGEAAIADNAAALIRNPALMAMFKETQFSGGLNIVDPKTNLTNINHSGQPLPDQTNITAVTPVPNVAWVMPINDSWAIGAAAFSNFATGSEYSKDFNNMGVAGLFGGKTQVTTANLNFSASYRINEQLSLGAGINAIYGVGDFMRTAPALGGLADVNFQGDGVTFGWDVGAVYEINADHRFGVSYRSGATIEAKGNGTFSVVELSSLKLNLPAMAEFSGFHQVADKWAVHYSAQWTGWSAFDAVNFFAGDDLAYAKQYGWEDSYRAALGTTYSLNQDWTLRAGLAYDKSPVPDSKRSISIPDSNRVWYSAGFGYKLNEKSNLDFGITWIDGEATQINEAIPDLATMSGITQTDALIYGLQYNRSF